MNDIKSFPAIFSKNARLLILGSMPSSTSLLKQQYYGHPRNAFWPIMGALFGAYPQLSYLQRTAILQQQRIAVWDVLKSCRREGSLDVKIDKASIQINEIPALFITCPELSQVFFNGTAAEKFYKRHILQSLPASFSYIHYQRLPSTSPAHASMSLAQKIDAWRALQLPRAR